MPQNTLSKFDIIAGYSAAFTAVLVSAVSVVSVQALQGAIPEFELSVIRGFVQGISYLTVGKLTGVNFGIHERFVPPIVYFSILFLIYNVGLFGSAAYITLLDITALFTTFTTISALIQAKVWFKMDIKKRQIISLFVCGVGVLVILQPEMASGLLVKLPKMLTSQLQNMTNLTNASIFTEVGNLNQQSITFTKLQKLKGYILVVIGGIAGGMCFDINAVKLWEVESLVKATYFSLLYLVMSVICMLYFENIVISLTYQQILFALSHAITCAGRNFLTVYSSHKIGGVNFSLMHKLQVIVYLIFQCSFMDSLMLHYTTGIELVGAVILIGGAMITPLCDIIQIYKHSSVLP